MNRIKKGFLSIIGILIIILLGVLLNYLFREKEQSKVSIFTFPSSFNCINEDISNKCVLKSNNNKVIIYIRKISIVDNKVLVSLLVNINNKEINELKVSKYLNQLAGAYITDDLFILGFNESTSECNINLLVYDYEGNKLEYDFGEYKVCKILNDRLELKDTFSCNNSLNSDKIVKKVINLQYANNILNEIVIDSSRSCD